MSRHNKNKHSNQQPKTKKPVFKRPSYMPILKPKLIISDQLSREITKDKTPVIERDELGNITHGTIYIGDDKLDYYIDYIDRRPIRYRDTRGRSWWIKYNSLGNISMYWDYTGYTEEYRYYANELVICTTSFGNKIKKHIKREPNKYISRDVFINTPDDYI